jgi:hypothetical protein
MFIDLIFPEVVAEKSTLRDILVSEAMARGLTNEQANAMLSNVHERLIDAGSFLDKMTGLWRYEFGFPFNIAEKHVWGTHMWVPVECLFTALYCAYLRLPDDKRATYLKRLADPQRHQDALVEMRPAHKVSPDVSLEFEIAGLGVGNRTVDWVIKPQSGRTVLLDVKSRIADFVNQMEQMDGESTVPEPDHDPALLFRSVAEKFVRTDPDEKLQGAWIFTRLQQEEDRLHHTFAALDASKVHFAILGDWKPDIYLLVQREEDRQYLLDLFHAEPSTRFTFKSAGKK